jgi:acetyl-CoA carboxylase, biotin carboxylase subunit
VLKRVLVANRGEIAVRIVRACHELGVEAVAVFSAADRLAPHVLEADAAYPIGPAASAQSYLRGDALIDVAQQAGCDAVHPGYGFLAERAPFAAAVEAAGLIFVGPGPEAIAAMGDKTEARRRVAEAGVPIVPGTAEPLQDADAALVEARAIGFPVMLKAAAGGGGKGMRIVADARALPRAFEAAGREAQAAFGDGSLYLERFLDGPRHIEIQVLADADGHVVHLGERECSIQRRHQKMIEEAPSAVLTPELRQAMGATAVAAARAVDYRNAGTIEFLYQDGDYYFLEMNTRLQVEHPVTELVTGLDLVHWQLRVAAGASLSFSQDDVAMHGHAVECRITSEDPWNAFLPSTGRISRLDVPAGPGIRWDGGVMAGSEVSLFYDPLLGKLIAYGPDRPAAIQRMRRALAELRVVGVETSAPFLARVMAEPDFQAGDIDIRYIERHADLLAEPPDALTRAAAVAAALLEHRQRESHHIGRIRAGGADGRWKGRGWRP